MLSAANANDATMFEAVLDDIPAIRMPTGRRPTKVHADKATIITAAGPPCTGVASAPGAPAA